MPDFELRVTPAAVAVPRGASVELTLHAIRRDGFKGEVRISQAGGEGLRLDGALVPAGVDTVRMTVSAAANAAGPAIFPRLAGTAVIDGKTVSRPVLPAEDLMQAFLYQHLMPFREQVVVLREPAALFSASIAIPPSGLLALPAGKETAFPVSVARQPGFSGPIRFHLVNPPKGVTLRNGWIAAGKNTGTVTLRTEAKVELALRSNLIFAASTPIEREATPEERARIEAREAKKAAVLAGTAATTPAAGAAAQPPSAQPAASSPPAAETPKKPLMITRQLVFTMPAVPFKVVEAPKTPKKTAEPPPATKGTHAGPNRKK